MAIFTIGVHVISTVIIQKEEIKGQITDHIINLLYVKCGAVYSLPASLLSFITCWLECVTDNFGISRISVFMFLQPLNIIKRETTVHVVIVDVVAAEQA